MDDMEFAKVDKAYLYFDKQLIRRTRNLRLIPNFLDRRGGKISYGEWCHVIGIFQTLLYLNLRNQTNNHILDIGCGAGLMGISSEPFLGKRGRYIGVDVNEKDIAFCRQHYSKEQFQFKHLKTFNPTYASNQSQIKSKWDVEDGSIDMVTALSVWTHLNEDDAIFYFHEINRVLKPKGRAIVTFFLIDDIYETTLNQRSDEKGRYHNTHQNLWIFDSPSSDSHMWFNPSWARQPEDAVGITQAGMDHLITNTDLVLLESYMGNWKEVPGIFFQDVLVFEKRAKSIEHGV